LGHPSPYLKHRYRQWGLVKNTYPNEEKMCRANCRASPFSWHRNLAKQVHFHVPLSAFS
jgi:hypothetical protein